MLVFADEVQVSSVGDLTPANSDTGFLTLDPGTCMPTTTPTPTTTPMPDFSIASRTEAVQNAIREALKELRDPPATIIPGPEETGVLSSDLNRITTLTLGQRITATLQQGDFANMPALQELRLNGGSHNPSNPTLNYNNLGKLPDGLFSGLTNLTGLFLGRAQISRLPADMFVGLTSLTEVYLNLQDFEGQGDKFSLPITLQQQQGSGNEMQVRAYIAHGAPFDMTGDRAITVTLTGDATFDDGTTMTKVEIGVGETESQWKRVVITNDDAWITADLEPPKRPRGEDGHSGYRIVPKGVLVLTLPQSLAGQIDISSRSPMIQNSIRDALEVLSVTVMNDDGNPRTLFPVTDLARITEIRLGPNVDLTIGDGLELQGGDLANLLLLETVDFSGEIGKFNKLGDLPEDLFNGLSNLTQISMARANITQLPADMFVGLTSLKTVYLNRQTGEFESNFDLPLFPQRQQGPGNQMQVQAYIAHGAPFNMTATNNRAITLTLTGGATFDNDTTMTNVEIGVGETASEWKRVVITNNDAMITVDLEPPENPDDDHLGYTIVSTGPLVLAVSQSSAGDIDISGRSTEVQKSIRAALEVLSPPVAVMNDEGNDRTSFPATDLARIISLRLGPGVEETLLAGDLANLPLLERLDFSGDNGNRNTLGTLPTGLFNGLSNLTQISMARARISQLPADMFVGLTSLEGVFLNLQDFEGQGDKFSLPITLQQQQGSGNEMQVRAYIAHGAPFNMTAANGNRAIALTLIGGATFDNGTTMTNVEIGVGKTVSDWKGVVITNNDAAIGVDFEPPKRPGSGHLGYTIVRVIEKGGLVLQSSAGQIDISSRSPMIQNSIRTALEALSPSVAVTDAQNNPLTSFSATDLARILNLRLGPGVEETLLAGDLANLPLLEKLDFSGDNGNRNTLGTLPTGLFRGLSNLRNIIMGRARISQLPADMFVGLTSLERVFLNLQDSDGQGSKFSLPLTIQWERTNSRVQAHIAHGAPFTMNIALTLTGGATFDNDTTMTNVEISVGRTESDWETITFAASSGASVTIDLELPNKPSQPHLGYDLTKSDDLPLTIRETLQLSVIDISGRTEAVQDAIRIALAALDPAPAITTGTEFYDIDLERIATLTITSETTDSLLTGDFADLPGLTTLSITENAMLSTLPEKIFNGLTAVTTLSITENAMLSTLPADIFDGLTAVTTLSITENAMLSTLPADIFDGLTAVTTLSITGNAMLSTLPAGIFNGLTAVTTLSITGNASLSTLPADIFDGLTAVTTLSITLSTLPVGIFNGLTTVTTLSITGSTVLSTLPAGIFNGLTAVTTLSLANNNLSFNGNAMPANILDGLAALETLTLNSNPLINVLPEDLLTHTPNLRIFNAISCNLRSLPSMLFANLSNLTHVNFESNQLWRMRNGILPDGLFVGLTNLISFYARHNGSGVRSVVTLHKSTDIPGSFAAYVRINTGAPYRRDMPLIVTNATLMNAAGTEALATTQDGLPIITTVTGYLDTPLFRVVPINDRKDASVDIGDFFNGHVSAFFNHRLIDQSDLLIFETPDRIDISGRTPAIQDAIRTALGEPADSTKTIFAEGDITDITTLTIPSGTTAILLVGDFADLSGLTELRMDGTDANPNSIGDANGRLPDGLFSGLTTLETLSFVRASIRQLPADMFIGLTALQTVSIEDQAVGQGNFELPVTVELDRGNTRVKLSIASGAPFTMVIRLTLTNATFSNSTATTDVTINIGTTESNEETITFTNDPLPEISLSIVLPDLPANHSGYAFTTPDLSLTLRAATRYINIKDRTKVVQEAIMRALNDLSAVPRSGTTTEFTESDLARIMTLTIPSGTALSSSSPLKSGDFNNLRGLTLLEMHGTFRRPSTLGDLPDRLFNDLTSLQTLTLQNAGVSRIPKDMFVGLTSLNVVILSNNLSNGIFELPLDIEWDEADNEVRVVIAHGAPFNLNLTLTLTGATFANGMVTTEATINVGEAESSRETITLAANRATVTIDFTLPTIPINHSGYRLIKESANPSTLLTAIDIITRTREVQDAIREALTSLSPTVTTGSTNTKFYQRDLGRITELTINDTNILTLKSGDFADLSGVETLSITDNDNFNLNNTPSIANIFSGLNALTELNLNNNPLGRLPESLHAAGVPNLETLNIDDCNLSSLPANLFNGLTQLTTVSLKNNPLSLREGGSGLPAGLFEGITTLTEFDYENPDLHYLGIRATLHKSTNPSNAAYVRFHTGAPHNVELSLFAINADLTNDAGETICDEPIGVNAVCSITIEAGQLNSPSFYFNAIDSTIDGEIYLISTTGGGIGNLPSTVITSLSNLDSFEYILIVDASMPLIIESTHQIDIGDRSELVRNAILAELENLEPPAGTVTGTLIRARDLPRITTLTLGSDKSGTLRVGDFAGMTQLTNLSLAGGADSADFNTLGGLPDRLFSDLSNLTELNLARARITTIPADIFHGLTNLNMVHLGPQFPDKVSPIELPLTIERDASNLFRLRVSLRHGAPFTMTVRIVLTRSGRTISTNILDAPLDIGTTLSKWYDIAPAGGGVTLTAALTPPDLPSGHSGYVFTTEGAVTLSVPLTLVTAVMDLGYAVTGTDVAPDVTLPAAQGGSGTYTYTLTHPAVGFSFNPASRVLTAIADGDGYQYRRTQTAGSTVAATYTVTDVMNSNNTVRATFNIRFTDPGSTTWEPDSDHVRGDKKRYGLRGGWEYTYTKTDSYITRVTLTVDPSNLSIRALGMPIGATAANLDNRHYEIDTTNRTITVNKLPFTPILGTGTIEYAVFDNRGNQIGSTFTLTFSDVLRTLELSGANDDGRVIQTIPAGSLRLGEPNIYRFAPPITATLYGAPSRTEYRAEFTGDQFICAEHVWQLADDNGVLADEDGFEPTLSAAFPTGKYSVTLTSVTFTPIALTAANPNYCRMRFYVRDADIGQRFIYTNIGRVPNPDAGNNFIEANPYIEVRWFESTVTWRVPITIGEIFKVVIPSDTLNIRSPNRVALAGFNNGRSIEITVTDVHNPEIRRLTRADSHQGIYTGDDQQPFATLDSDYTLGPETRNSDGIPTRTITLSHINFEPSASDGKLMIGVFEASVPTGGAPVTDDTLEVTFTGARRSLEWNLRERTINHHHPGDVTDRMTRGEAFTYSFASPLPTVTVRGFTPAFSLVGNTAVENGSISWEPDFDTTHVAEVSSTGKTTLALQRVTFTPTGTNGQFALKIRDDNTNTSFVFKYQNADWINWTAPGSGSVAFTAPSLGTKNTFLINPPATIQVHGVSRPRLGRVVTADNGIQTQNSPAALIDDDYTFSSDRTTITLNRVNFIPTAISGSFKLGVFETDPTLLGNNGNWIFTGEEEDVLTVSFSQARSINWEPAEYKVNSGIPQSKINRDLFVGVAYTIDIGNDTDFITRVILDGHVPSYEVAVIDFDGVVEGSVIIDPSPEAISTSYHKLTSISFVPSAGSGFIEIGLNNLNTLNKLQIQDGNSDDVFRIDFQNAHRVTWNVPGVQADATELSVNINSGLVFDEYQLYAFTFANPITVEVTGASAPRIGRVVASDTDFGNDIRHNDQGINTVAVAPAEGPNGNYTLTTANGITTITLTRIFIQPTASSGSLVLGVYETNAEDIPNIEDKLRGIPIIDNTPINNTLIITFEGARSVEWSTPSHSIDSGLVVGSSYTHTFAADSGPTVTVRGIATTLSLQVTVSLGMIDVDFEPKTFTTDPNNSEIATLTLTSVTFTPYEPGCPDGNWSDVAPYQNGGSGTITFNVLASGTVVTDTLSDSTAHFEFRFSNAISVAWAYRVARLRETTHALPITYTSTTNTDLGRVMVTGVSRPRLGIADAEGATVLDLRGGALTGTGDSDYNITTTDRGQTYIKITRVRFIPTDTSGKLFIRVYETDTPDRVPVPISDNIQDERPGRHPRTSGFTRLRHPDVYQLNFRSTNPVSVVWDTPSVHFNNRVINQHNTVVLTASHVLNKAITITVTNVSTPRISRVAGLDKGIGPLSSATFNSDYTIITTGTTHTITLTRIHFRPNGPSPNIQNENSGFTLGIFEAAVPAGQHWIPIIGAGTNPDNGTLTVTFETAMQISVAWRTTRIHFDNNRVINSQNTVVLANPITITVTNVRTPRISRVAGLDKDINPHPVARYIPGDPASSDYTINTTGSADSPTHTITLERIHFIPNRPSPNSGNANSGFTLGIFEAAVPAGQDWIPISDIDTDSSNDRLTVTFKTAIVEWTRNGTPIVDPITISGTGVSMRDRVNTVIKDRLNTVNLMNELGSPITVTLTRITDGRIDRVGQGTNIDTTQSLEVAVPNTDYETETETDGTTTLTLNKINFIPTATSGSFQLGIYDTSTTPEWTLISDGTSNLITVNYVILPRLFHYGYDYGQYGFRIGFSSNSEFARNGSHFGNLAFNATETGRATDTYAILMLVHEEGPPSYTAIYEHPGLVIGGSMQALTPRTPDCLSQQLSLMARVIYNNVGNVWIYWDYSFNGITSHDLRPRSSLPTLPAENCRPRYFSWNNGDVSIPSQVDVIVNAIETDRSTNVFDIKVSYTVNGSSPTYPLYTDRYNGNTVASENIPSGSDFRNLEADSGDYNDCLGFAAPIDITYRLFWHDGDLYLQAPGMGANTERMSDGVTFYGEPMTKYDLERELPSLPDRNCP